MARWERIIRGVGVTCLIAFLVLALTPLANIAGRRFGVSGPVEKADAIVVLGAGLIDDQSLVEESLRRVVRGVELYKLGLAPLMVLLGPHGRDARRTEAEVRGRFALAMGVPAADILTIDTASTTREEAAETARVLATRGKRRLLLVTESLHMRRAALVFAAANLEVLPAISSDYPAGFRSPQGRIWLTLRIAQETLGLVYYRIAGYI